MGRSVAKLLFSLSLGPERKVKCYNGYFVNRYVLHTEEYRHGRKTYSSGVCVKGSTSSELEVDYYGRLEEVVFFFAKQCQQVYYTYTPSFRKDRSRVD